VIRMIQHFFERGDGLAIFFAAQGIAAACLQAGLLINDLFKGQQHD
jgi:hypothetical protein